MLYELRVLWNEITTWIKYAYKYNMEREYDMETLLLIQLT